MKMTRDAFHIDELPDHLRIQAVRQIGDAKRGIRPEREIIPGKGHPPVIPTRPWPAPPAPPQPKKTKPKRTDGYKSQLEADYAAHLDCLVRSGEIDKWEYEWATYRLSKNVRYTPDFALFKGNSIRFVETKGRWQADALVKFRIARDELPYAFTAVKRIKGQWAETANPAREKRKSERT